MTFDEFLKEPANQAEFDKRIDKALDTATKKLTAEFESKLSTSLKSKEDEIAAKQKEIEENAKLSESEKHKKDMEKLAKERDELASYKSKREMTDKARAYIKEKGYDASIEDLIDLSSFADDNDMATRLLEANTKFTSKVSESLNAKLKENGYADLADKNKGGAGKKDQFNFNFTPIKPVESGK